MSVKRLFFSISLLIYLAEAEVCFNPNQHKGYCSSIKECPVLKALQSKDSISQDEKRFLQESKCTGGFGDPPFVCCTEDVNFYSAELDEKPLTRSQIDLLPDLKDCGRKPSEASPKIYGGEETTLDDFPWMALLNYGTEEDPKFYCGGSLINSKYVLTAAHCVAGKPLQSVRLGVYDTTQTNYDYDLELGTVKIAHVDEIVIHPNYNNKSIHRHNDIALVRLMEDLELTYFISPICLPSVLGLNRTKVGTNLVAAGWGRTLKAKSSNIKLKVSLPVYPQDECQKAYKRTRAHLLDNQLCAGGKFVEDTCGGDSGGPLMYFKDKWAIEGIVSYSRGCGLENLPGIYTRVAEYEDWIRNNIKP